MGKLIKAFPVIPGCASGYLLVGYEPLSFWGGYDYHTGEITDRRHPLSGQNAIGKIVALPFSRGSSTTTAVLLEAVRRSTAPRAILSTGVDSFFALASIVAAEMYKVPFPVLKLSQQDFNALKTDSWVEIDQDGSIRVA